MLLIIVDWCFGSTRTQGVTARAELLSAHPGLTRFGCSSNILCPEVDSRGVRCGASVIGELTLFASLIRINRQEKTR